MHIQATAQKISIYSNYNR